MLIMQINTNTFFSILLVVFTWSRASESVTAHVFVWIVLSHFGPKPMCVRQLFQKYGTSAVTSLQDTNSLLHPHFHFAHHPFRLHIAGAVGYMHTS